MNYEITCCVCGKKLIGDGEPCCGDIVCVAVMNHEFDKSEAVIEVEKILYNEWLEMKAAEYGIQNHDYRMATNQQASSTGSTADSGADGAAASVRTAAMQERSQPDKLGTC